MSNGHNEDVELLLAASSVKADSELIESLCLQSPIAPHLAADRRGP